MGKLFVKFFTDLRSMYQQKPPAVTVLGTGALHVDAAQLLQSDEAKRQLDALKDFPVHRLPPEKAEAHPQ